MNKYIKTDVEQAMTLLKVAINNALSDLEEGKEEEIHFDYPLPLQLILECADDRGWLDDHVDDWTNGWEVDYWYRMAHSKRESYLYIDGSLLNGNTVISIKNEYSDTNAI
jgi:hypothetical protein